jgi:hypothetical protein
MACGAAVTLIAPIVVWFLFVVLCACLFARS